LEAVPVEHRSDIGRAGADLHSEVCTMTGRDQDLGGGIAPAVMAWGDEACDRFQADWNAGPDPQIEDYLASTGEPGRAVLLEALVRLECGLRSRAGEQPNGEAYRRRFPRDAAVVDTIFGPVPDRSGADGTIDHDTSPALRLAESRSTWIGPYRLG